MIVMIILLILCLPLILMLSLFTTTNVVSIVVDVPVTGIDVAIEEVIELDLDKGESFEVDYVISPTEASKKDVKYSFAPIGEEKLAEFSIDGNKLTPTSHGQAIVSIETVDGGFRDSFIVYVFTNRVTDFECTLEKDAIIIGEKTVISSVFSPEEPIDNRLTYSVKQGSDIVEVNRYGEVTGIGIGTAVIEVASVDKPEIKKDVTVRVVSSGVIDFAEDTDYLTALENSGEIKSVLNPEITVASHSIELLDKDGAPLADSIVDVTFDPVTGKVSYSFIDQAFVGVIEIKLTVTPEGGEAVTKSCYINRISEIEVDWADAETLDNPVMKNQSIDIVIDLQPKGADVSFELTTTYKKNASEMSDPTTVILEDGVVYTCPGEYISVTLDGNVLTVYGLKAAESGAIKDTLTTLSIRVIDNNDSDSEPVVLATKNVVVFE